MEDTIDLLKIKIEKAKRELPLETVNAIDAVDWRAAILGLRTKYGYTFEQLGDLELETELLLSGLISPADYPRELEHRMEITKAATNELVNEMNNLVFKKIQEELVKNAERKKTFEKSQKPEVIEKKAVLSDTQTLKVLSSAGIEIIPNTTIAPKTQSVQTEALELMAPIESREDMLKKIEKPEPARPLDLSGAGGVIHPILAQKLSGSVQNGMVKTEHSLDNITPTSRGVGVPTENVGTKLPKVDPYREIPE